MKNKVDIFGKSINIGDPVIYSDKYVGLLVSRVKKFSKVKVHLENYDGMYYSCDLLVISEDQYKYDKT